MPRNVLLGRRDLRTLPRVHEVPVRQVRPIHPREVRVEDLLRREPVD